jgi:hypothetical protein
MILIMKIYNRLLVQCHSCTQTKSNLYSDIYLATVTSEPALYRFLTTTEDSLTFKT